MHSATRIFVSFALTGLLLPFAAGQHGSTTAVNPYTGPQHAAEGAKLYRAQCAVCHGPEGAGTASGPDLTTGSLKRGGSDEALFQSISKGVPGTAMPAFNNLGGQRTWQLVTHLRSLLVARSSAHIKGDPAAGSRVYASLDCAACHTVGLKGGLSGPDLTRIGAARSAQELRQSVNNPDAHVASQFWSAVVKMSDGRTLHGTRLNEDTHSLQLRDQSGQLISILKRDIADYEIVRKSPMPSYHDKLQGAALENLLAYLASLRGDAKGVD